MRVSTRREAGTIALVVLLTGVLAVGLVGYFEPFWLIKRATDIFLWRNGVHQREVLVDGHRIHYLEAAPAQSAGPDKPIVLVHGLGARASDWATLTPTLARHGYHVYALDLLGYGKSDKPSHGDASLAAEEQIVAHFMDTLGLQQPDLAGWSMGGWIAAKLALDEPSRVKRLLLFDSAGLYMPVDFPLTLFTPSTPAEFDQLVDRIEPDHHFVRIPSFAVAGLLRNFQRGRWFVDSSLDSMLNGHEVLNFRLHRLTMPVLLVWGSEDHLTPLSAGEQMHALLPQSVLIELQGCGHLAIVECAGRATPPVLHFLDAEPPEKSGVQIIPASPR